ncbi:unnamed protein product [Ambrosiozyma monospora]|uniref:Unnamed protein product n=1 Tax=Ambrosiozyma monospora TaxID=43982 RepID=A0ACB5SZ43_AMBMO|nr:unnamed protein product [Ambrosiozyma monospora]
MLSRAFLISKRRLIPTLAPSTVSRSSVLFFNNTVTVNPLRFNSTVSIPDPTPTPKSKLQVDSSSKTTNASEFSAEIDESSIHPNKPRKFQPRRQRQKITNYQDAIDMGLAPGNILFALVEDPTVDLTTIHEAISKYFTSGIPERIRGPLAQRLFSKLAKVNEQNETKVSNSYHFKKVLNQLLESQIATSSLIDRTVCQLLHEGDFGGALALWIQGLEYVKQYPEAFGDKIRKEAANDGAVTENAHKKVPISRETQFATTGLVSYFLSLKQDAKSELDPEFVKLIIGDLKGRERPNFFQVKYLLNRLQISEENSKFVSEQWDNYRLSKVDYNELQAWETAMNSAHLGRSRLANTQIENNLKHATERGVKLSADIWAYIMRIYIISKNFPAALNVFSKLGEHGVSKPTAELWNELLSVHSKLNTPHKKQRVDAVTCYLITWMKP